MSDLYFAPAARGNEGRYGYDHLQSTVISPVGVSEVYGFPITYQSHVHVWGIWSSTSQHCAHKPGCGDYLLFYIGDGEYSFAARIDQTELNRELAEDLWPDFPKAEAHGDDTPGEPWEFIMYLDTVWAVNVPGNAVQGWKRDQDSVTRRFQRLPTHRRRRLREYFGSIPGFLFNWGHKVVGQSE